MSTDNDDGIDGDGDDAIDDGGYGDSYYDFDDNEHVNRQEWHMSLVMCSHWAPSHTHTCAQSRQSSYFGSPRLTKMNERFDVRYRF